MEDTPSTSVGTKRKKKSRWGKKTKKVKQVEEIDPETLKALQAKKGKRWGSEDERIMLSQFDIRMICAGGASRMTFDDTRKFIEAMRELTAVTELLHSPKRLELYDDGQPEPKPIYDEKGVRTNTKLLRFTALFKNRRMVLIKTLLDLNPQYSPPEDYVPPKATKVLWIPQEEYPHINFMGYLIGPRGISQQKLEKATKCNIAVRGKGSFRPGKAPPNQEGMDLPMHVFITGPDMETVEAAAKKLTEMMDPSNFEQQKKDQMMQLAVIQGQSNHLVENFLTCTQCGQMGHTISNCPERASSKWWEDHKKLDIRCKICNSLNHLTADCLVKEENQTKAEAIAENEKKMDEEYNKFMRDVTENDAFLISDKQPKLPAPTPVPAKKTPKPSLPKLPTPVTKIPIQQPVFPQQQAPYFPPMQPGMFPQPNPVFPQMQFPQVPGFFPQQGQGQYYLPQQPQQPGWINPQGFQQWGWPPPQG